MIPPDKLHQLTKGQRRRKLALCFGSLERDIAGIAEKGSEYSFHSMTRQEYTKRIVEIVLDDPQLPENAKKEIQELLNEEPFDERRICKSWGNSSKLQRSQGIVSIHPIPERIALG